MMRRFSSITLTAMVRCEVASGMATQAAMFSAMRAGGAAQRLQLLAGAASGAADGRWGAAGGRGGAVAAVAGGTGLDSKTCFQLSSTVERSCRYC